MSRERRIAPAVRERRAYEPTPRDLDRYKFPREVGRPEPGLYEMRLRRRGATCAALILYAPSTDPETGQLLDRSPYWQGIINGEPDPKATREFPSERVWMIWHNRALEPINAERFRWLIEHRRWARIHKPMSAEADPWREPDPLQSPLPF